VATTLPATFAAERSAPAARRPAGSAPQLSLSLLAHRQWRIHAAPPKGPEKYF